MYQFMTEVLAHPLGLPIPALWEYGILALMALAAFTLWRGGQLDSGMLRMGIFLTAWLLVYGLLAVAQWVIAHWMLTLGVLVAGIVVTFAIWIMVRGFLCSW